MPDLPLPKPQPPTSTSDQSSNSQSSGSQDKSSMAQPTQSVPSTQPTQPYQSSQSASTSPLGAPVSPQAVPQNKPPAVVTALSSVSSNQIPKIPLDLDEDKGAQQDGINASAFPTSTPTVVPPPTLSSAKNSQNQNQIPARGSATNQAGILNPATASVSNNGTSPTITPPHSTSQTISESSTSTIPPLAQPSISQSPVTKTAVSQPSTSQSTSSQSVLPPATPTLSTSATAPSLSLPASQSPVINSTPNSNSLPTSQLRPLSSPSSSPPQIPAPTSIAASSQAAPSQPAPPKLASPKKSPFKLIIGILVGVIGLLVVVGVIMAFLNRPGRTSVGSSDDQPAQPSGQTTDQTASVTNGEQTTIEYWGLWEQSETLSQVFEEFQTQNPGLTVRYIQQSHRDYRERLQNAIASGSGPDVFRFHASWVPMLTSDLEPMPASVMSASDFAQTFYAVASNQLQNNGQLVGLPLMYEGLVLYYNQDVLETAGVQPPQTWSALRDAARTLSIKQANGQLQRGGVAIGTADNVDHFADILAVLMLQNGANLEQPNSPEGRDALLFYTNFVKQDQVWSADLPSSTIAFARGDVAMMFAPSWRAFEITQINPNLRFAAVTLPQLPNNKITWASYWAEGVSQKSSNKEAAWQLLQYLSQKDIQQKLFTAQSQTRAFGEPFSRVDLADQAASQPIVGPLLQDAPSAQGWYMSTFTHDNDINDQIVQYYKEAINSLLSSGTIDEVLVTLQDGVNQVLSTYGVVELQEPTPTVAQY